MKHVKVRRRLIQILLSIVAVIVFLLLWQGVVPFLHVSELVLPRPLSVLRSYGAMIQNNRLAFHSWVTIEEALVGFIFGTLLGTLLGYLTAKSRTLELVLLPLIVAAQTTPKFALAPLFLVWFGFGIVSKVLITALVVFFPIFVNTVLAIKSVNPNLRDLMTLSHASSWQVLSKLEIPSSLPIFFAGLKSGITLAFVGAVVGEFVGAKAGLGYLIIFATGYLDTATVFVAVIQLAFIGIVFYECVSLLGSKLTKWHQSEKIIVKGE